MKQQRQLYSLTLYDEQDHLTAAIYLKEQLPSNVSLNMSLDTIFTDPASPIA